MGAPVGNCNAAKNKATCRSKRGRLYLLRDSAKPIKRITFGSGRSMIIPNKRSPIRSYGRPRIRVPNYKRAGWND